MAFNNGMTSVKNNIRLKGIYRRPKLLGNHVSFDPVPAYDQVKYELNTETDQRATFNRIKKYVIILGIIVTALIATVYTISMYM